MTRKKKTIFFVGSRWLVLEKILSLPFVVTKVFTPANSYLEKELRIRGIKFDILSTKQELIDEIKKTKFDIFISNGCPYILPIAKLKKNKQLFINVHPSLLPDLRGGSPVNGAILFNKPTGATCHHMDDNIDTGFTISRVDVYRTDDIDLGLLYQLCFLAEADAFWIAYKRDFKPLSKKLTLKKTIYFTRTENDMLIDFSEDINTLIRRIKAFAVPKQGAFFFYKNKRFKVLDAAVVYNKFLSEKIKTCKKGDVVLKHENYIIVKFDKRLLKLCIVDGDLNHVKIGDNLIVNKKLIQNKC